MAAAAELDDPLARHRPTWAEIDLDALASNVRLARARAGSVPLLAVVKADAYGHGAAVIGPFLEKEGIDVLGVALPEEGAELRGAGVRRPIVLLGGCTPAQADLVLSLDLTPAVYRKDQIEALSAAARRRGVTARVHVKIDTGMGRLGVPAAEAAELARAIAGAAGVAATGAFTHFAVADDPADRFTQVQIERFDAAVAALRAAGLRPDELHVANSAALTDLPDAHLTLVRPGIVLYGYAPSPRVATLPWRPVMALRTRIIYLKEVAAGTSLGYGRTFVTSRPSRIASLAIGYDDGLPRLAGGRGWVLVRGRRAPIVGRVSMDLTTIDVTDVPGAALGDVVAVIGSDGDLTLGADQVAAWAETIPWEVLCGIGRRVPRLYVSGDERSAVSRFGRL